MIARLLACVMLLGAAGCSSSERTAQPPAAGAGREADGQTATPPNNATPASEQAGPPLQVGHLYEFPDELDLHYPVLMLRADGRFAFLADAEDAAAEEFENYGTWAKLPDGFRLTYEEASCCRFVDIDAEDIRTAPSATTGSLTAIANPGRNIAVRFRGETVKVTDMGPLPAGP